MKRLLLVSGFCLTTVVTRPAAAEPFDEAKGYMFYAINKPIRKTIVPPRAMPADDYVIGLSKASDINFIADATQIPAGAKMQPFPASAEAIAGKWKPAFYGVLEDFKLAKRLSSLRYDETTFLLWSEPELFETAKLIVAAGKHRPSEPLPNQFDLYRALHEYARDKPGGNGDANPNTPFKWKGKMGNLPPALQAQMVALARHGILRSDFRHELMLSDNYWQTARVRLFPFNEGRAYIPFVAGQDENGRPLPFYRPWPKTFQFADANVSQRLYPRLDAAGQTQQTQVLEPDTPTAVPKAEDLPAPGLSAVELEAQQPLQVKISLEGKRRPLANLLAGVGPKNGVTLVVEADAGAPASLVTARVSQMPLATFMGAIARVYGAYWTQKTATEYVLHLMKLDALQSALLQSGEGDFFTKDAAWQTTEERKQQLYALEQEIVGELNGQQADKPQGVEVSLLSDDVQRRLRRTFEETAAEEIIAAHQKASKFLFGESVLYIDRASVRRLSGWNVALRMADGREALMSTNLDAPIDETETPSPTPIDLPRP